MSKVNFTELLKNLSDAEKIELMKQLQREKVQAKKQKPEAKKKENKPKKVKKIPKSLLKKPIVKGGPNDTKYDLIKKAEEELMQFKKETTTEMRQHRKVMNQYYKAVPLKKSLLASALKNYTTSYTISPDKEKEKDLELFLNRSKYTVHEIISNELKAKKGIKCQLTCKIEFKKKTLVKNFKTGEVSTKKEYKIGYMNAKTFEAINRIGLINKIQRSNNEILKLVDQFTNEGSGWTINEIYDLFVNIATFKPLSGSSFVELPAQIQNTKSCINVVNKDNQCFKYAILSMIHPVAKNAFRLSNYIKYFDELNFAGIDFPISVNSFKKFENQNDVSINVISTEKQGKDYMFYPIYKTQNKKEKHANLLLYEGHYVGIKSMSRLLNFDRTHDHEAFYCFSCLNHFDCKDKLDAHVNRGCNVITTLEMPTKDDNTVRFTDDSKMLPAPFVICADTECLTLPCDDTNGSTYTYQKHEANSWCIHVKCYFKEHNKLFPLVKYRGPNAIYKLLEQLQTYEKQMIEIIKTNKEMIITSEQENEFKTALNCHICGGELKKDRVRDHCHITGLYRGPAHYACNINYKYSLNIPVFFHNMKGYDSHLIIKELGKFEGNINCIAQSSEKFISFSLGHLVFKDSFAFMAQSLDKLSSYLNFDDFKITRDYYNGMADEKIKLLIRKGVYPYDYMNSWDRFNETCLPSKEDFYSKLTDSNISDDDYKHAVNVFKTFECKNMGDYNDLYLVTDVLLLADVFDNFRKVCISNYKLDPANFLTAPSLSWSSGLLFTKKEIELMTDVDMYQMVDSGIRGGMSTVITRYAKANNKYMNDYNPNEKESFITYLDANNLYGWSMSEKLPLKDYKWNTEEWNQDKVMNIDINGDTGYIFDCDLEYPEHLHDKHQDYPLAPENLEIQYEMLSDYNKECLDLFGQKFTKSNKLCATVKNKTNYVVHIKNLQFYLSQGLLLTKVHRVIQFHQEAWLKPYIEFNSNKRKVSKNDFEKEFYKLMNNSIFGKTMEDVLNRKNYRLINCDKKLLKCTKKPQYRGFNIITEDLVGVDMAMTNVKLNKPIIVGFSILDISKIRMYDFYYNTIKRKYNDKAKLLYTDTDSLIMHIETEDLFKDFTEYKHELDLSDYTNEYKCLDNKKIIGKFKDEAIGKIITEFIGLRSKMYSFLIQGDDEEHKKGKGIKSYVVKKHLKHDDYLQTVNQKIKSNVSMNSIRSFNHNLSTITINKIGLSSYSDKVYLLDNGIDSLPYGHYKINNLN